MHSTAKFQNTWKTERTERRNGKITIVLGNFSVLFSVTERTRDINQ